MKIALVCPGRFHIFDLARELLDRGHDVTVFTHYPRWAAQRFGLSGRIVRPFTLHGVVTRVVERMCRSFRWKYPEAPLLRWFGRWAAGQISRERWDVVNCMSGSAEETFSSRTAGGFLKQLTRLSSHIRTQARILEEEEQRVGRKIPKPSDAMIAREEREYRQADQIHVPSAFARQSFAEQKVPAHKLRQVPLGVEVAAFRPEKSVIEQRCKRIRAGEPLRILYVGAVSYRKGMADFASIVRNVDPDRFRFRLVGALERDTLPLWKGLEGRVEKIPSQPQKDLPRWYAWGDVFLFPTIEDGYAMVLPQALASGLPLLVTQHCGGPDFIQEGESGWVLPIRRPELFADRLRWCDLHREELAGMVRRIYENPGRRVKDWKEVALEFEKTF